MPITRMNHAVLHVREVARTVAFYKHVLGFRVRYEIPGQAAILQAPARQTRGGVGISFPALV